MGYGTQQFLSNVKTQSFGKMDDWKKEGKTVGWIHPAGFRDRKMHNMMIASVKGKEGKRFDVMKRFTCAGQECPLCALVEWAKGEAEGIDEREDFPVLNRVIKATKRGEQDKSISYSVRELAGMGDWRHRMGPTAEYLWGWVRRDKRSKDSPVTVLQGGQGLVTAIKRVIESQIEDRGEAKGDPLRNPYAFKLIYNKDETPQHMYQAERVDSDLAPIDEAVKEILGTELTKFGIDLDRMVQRSSPGDILDSVELCWDEDCPTSFQDFAKFYESVCGPLEEQAELEEEAPEPEGPEEDGKTDRERRMDRADARREEMHGRRQEQREPEEPPRASRRSRAEPAQEPEEPPARSGRRRAEPEKAPEEPGLVPCPECNQKVKPSKRGRCPECGLMLGDKNADVPY